MSLKRRFLPALGLKSISEVEKKYPPPVTGLLFVFCDLDYVVLNVDYDKDEIFIAECTEVVDGIVIYDPNTIQSISHKVFYICVVGGNISPLEVYLTLQPEYVN